MFALDPIEVGLSSAHDQHRRTCTCQIHASMDPILDEEESRGSGG